MSNADRNRKHDRDRRDCPTDQRPDPDHGGIARWRADLVDDRDIRDDTTGVTR